MCSLWNPIILVWNAFLSPLQCDKHTHYSRVAGNFLFKPAPRDKCRKMHHAIGQVQCAARGFAMVWLSVECVSSSFCVAVMKRWFDAVRACVLGNYISRETPLWWKWSFSLGDMLWNEYSELETAQLQLNVWKLGWIGLFSALCRQKFNLELVKGKERTFWCRV